MQRLLKLMHFGGLVIFLGSILTFIVISNPLQDTSLQNIAFGRQIISTGTTQLTLPGMWLLAIIGIWMGYKRYGLKQRFFQLKFLLITIIIINAHFFVVPAVTLTTELSAQSVAQCQLHSEYSNAYMQESLFGAVNVLLTLTAVAFGVWRAHWRKHNVTSPRLCNS